jgi:hypothetical protein
MPQYGIPDWTRSEEDYRVLEASGDVLALTKGDVFMVFRRVRDEEYDRRLAGGVGVGADDAEPDATPDRGGM